MKLSGKKIELCMARRALSTNELSKRSGICRQNLSAIKNRSDCRPTTAAKLAAALGVDVTEIME